MELAFMFGASCVGAGLGSLAGHPCEGIMIGFGVSVIISCVLKYLNSGTSSKK